MDNLMQIPLVDLKAQYLSIKDEIDSAISDVISKAAFIGGPFVKAFEETFAVYCGARFCIGVGNGTDAIFIALKSLGIGQGDEVITVANSFVATSEAISQTGARVVFVDIDPATYNIDPKKIGEKITAKTRAIVPVHLYGQPADMVPIRELAQKHGLYIVGDAAQAHGAMYHGKHIAQLADITCFSFYPGKNLGAYGDGGALVTDNEEWASQIRKFANHGRARKYDHDFEGVNSRLDGLQAAILTAKLKHLDDWSDGRRRNAYLYNEYLKDLDVITPKELDNVRAVYHLYVLRLPNDNREQLQEHLKNHGVSTGVHYPIALPYLNAYKHFEHTPADFPQALSVSQQIVSLPIFPELTKSQIEYICEKIKGFIF
jgi:dTDP-4-amino-4,6-dideoxygalactose transaminase